MVVFGRFQAYKLRGEQLKQFLIALTQMTGMVLTPQ